MCLGKGWVKIWTAWSSTSCAVLSVMLMLLWRRFARGRHVLQTLIFPSVLNKLARARSISATCLSPSRSLHISFSLEWISILLELCARIQARFGSLYLKKCPLYLFFVAKSKYGSTPASLQVKFIFCLNLSLYYNYKKQNWVVLYFHAKLDRIGLWCFQSHL
jgi:hypothetical protein